MTNDITTKKDNNNKSDIEKEYEIQQNSFRIGFGHLLYYFMNATPESILIKAVMLFNVLNATFGIRSNNPPLAATVFPPEHAMSSGRMGYCLYQVNSICNKIMMLL